ncbi:MAG: hypothetical protein ACI93S_000038 [Ancylomarina sp.]|jgi:hypothetical protein
MGFKRIQTLIFILLLTSSPILAQNSIQLIPESSSIRIFGTSNIHDWEMHVELQAKTPEYIIPDNSIKNLKDIQFKIDGVKIKSIESAMEKKAHKALKLPNFPFISFHLKKVSIKNHKTTNFSAFAIGTLLISGHSKDVKLPISGNFVGNKKLNLTGHLDLKMSDFEIEAPSAFFGAITTADEIKILYSLDFISKQKLTQDMLNFNLNP